MRNENVTSAAGEGGELGGHDGLHEFEYMVACAMAGIELRLGIIGFQSLSQSFNLFVRLQTIEQMETTNNGMNGPRTCGQNVL